jgi:hypothetical protein
VSIVSTRRLRELVVIIQCLRVFGSESWRNCSRSSRYKDEKTRTFVGVGGRGRVGGPRVDCLTGRKSTGGEREEGVDLCTSFVQIGRERLSDMSEWMPIDCGPKEKAVANLEKSLMPHRIPSPDVSSRLPKGKRRPMRSCARFSFGQMLRSVVAPRRAVNRLIEVRFSAFFALACSESFGWLHWDVRRNQLCRKDKYRSVLLRALSRTRPVRLYGTRMYGTGPVPSWHLHG